MCEAVEETRRVCPEDEDAEQGRDTGHHAHDQRAKAKRERELLLVMALAVARQVHGGEIGGHLHSQNAPEDRRWVEPAGDHVASSNPQRHPPGGDRAGDRSEKEWRDHRRQGERSPECTLQRQLRDRAAERERGAAEDHPERHGDERDVQRRRDRGKHRREPGPGDHQREDEPHVVGFPDRADRLRDAPALGGTGSRRARDEVPETGTEVGAGEQDVRGDASPEKAEHDVGVDAAAHDALAALMRRSTNSVIAVSPVYTISSTTSPQYSPGAGLTASDVRITL